MPTACQSSGQENKTLGVIHCEMPLTPNSVFDGFGRAGSYVLQVPQPCQKRKLSFGGGDLDHDMEEAGSEQSFVEGASGPKRQCHWPSHGTNFTLSSFQHSQERQEQAPTTDTQPRVHHTFTSAPDCVSSSVLPLQVTPEIAASVAFSSAAFSSSPSSSVATSLVSPLRSSSPYPQDQATSNNLANVFIARLRQRQREEALRLAATASDNITQELSQAVEMGMEEENLKEKNNNLTSSSIKPSQFPESGYSDPYEAMDGQVWMESDFVPDRAQYAPASAPSQSSPTASLSSSSSSSPQQQPLAAVSTPQHIHATDERSGLKPSPVTGRLHCLCSASWRGMYGMDGAYMTDYY